MLIREGANTSPEAHFELRDNDSALAWQIVDLYRLNTRLSINRQTRVTRDV